MLTPSAKAYLLIALLLGHTIPYYRLVRSFIWAGQAPQKRPLPTLTATKIHQIFRTFARLRPEHSEREHLVFVPELRAPLLGALGPGDAFVLGGPLMVREAGGRSAAAVRSRVGRAGHPSGGNAHARSQLHLHSIRGRRLLAPRLQGSPGAHSFAAQMPEGVAT